VCDVGASYSSKRQETADKLIQLITAQPELVGVTGDLLFKALDLPMADQIAERLQAQMNPVLLGEDPQANRLKQAAQAVAELEERILNYEAALADKQKDKDFEQNVQLQELLNEKRKIDIEARKTMADIEKMRAETANYNMEAVNQSMQNMGMLSDKLSDIEETLVIMLDAKEAETNQVMSEPEIEDEIVETQ
jgi:small-conductance mechanosensitive channel